MESHIFVILSMDHHGSSIFVLPESHGMISKLKQLEKLGEIDYFNLDKYTEDEKNTINFCCNEDFMYNKKDNPDCLDCYSEMKFPLRIVDVINLSIPMN